MILKEPKIYPLLSGIYYAQQQKLQAIVGEIMEIQAIQELSDVSISECV